MNQEQPKNRFEDVKTCLVWLTVLVQILAASVEVFLHRRFGSRYLGFQALGVLLLVPFYSMFWQGHDLRPLVWFMVVFVVLCFVARIGVAMREFRGQHEHSHYPGYPRIKRFLPWVTEISVKQGVEPLLVFVTGVFTLSYSQPLGSYLMLAASGLFSTVYLSRDYDRQRVQDLHDGYLDQRNLTEQFNRMRGDQY